MLEIKMTGLCSGCQEANLFIGSETVDGEIRYWIRCAHSKACDAIEDKVIDRLVKGKDFAEELLNR